MSQALHLLANNVPGYGPSGISARSTAICSCSSRVDHIIHSHAKIVPSKCCIKGSSSSSSGRRRNPDFSRQMRHGFSRNRNRENEGKDNFLNLEESDILSSKNGPSLSLPSAPKSQTPSAPGPKEKEIVELFRKVQVQLRERAAMKEEKRTEPLKGQDKESETVDSLLKLLRKHSAEQGKRSSATDMSFNQLENNDSNIEGKGMRFIPADSSSKDDFQESPSLSSRPASNFQRRSPVPRVKYQPIYSGETKVDSAGQISLNGRRMKNEIKLESELEPERGPDISFLQGRVSNSMEEGSLEVEEGFNEEDEAKSQLNEQKNLSEMKLTELKAIAKSRGLKGFSKMKKIELVELLHEA